MNRFEKLNSSFKIGNVTIRNRFTVAPMSPGFTNYPNGAFTPEGTSYYLNRARGGFGLIFTGAFSSDKTVDAFNKLSPYPTNDPAAFRNSALALTRRAETYGAKMFAQITLGVGRNYPASYAPSAIPVFQHPDMTAPELTVEQIHEKVRQFAETAKLCKESGFAGVEIHALHWGYLLDEFAMSLTNHRTDEYGGSLENRLRITKEAIEAAKEACGQDYPVSVRLGMKSYVKDLQHASVDGSEEGGRTVEEAIEIAKLLESYGADALNVDTGIYESFYYACPPTYIQAGYAQDMAARLKAAVHIPVILGGRMGDVEIDEKGIEEGKFDAVALGRPSLADPDLPKKTEAGRPEEIRPCIACNQGCLYRLLETGETALCAVNPSVGRDNGYEITRALQKKKVVIVGGGVAGMEAARVCALRGHDVSLYEKSSQPGGNLLPAGAHSFKREILELNDWYKVQMKDLKVDVHLNSELHPEDIRAMHADAIILATGSSPVMPKIDGINHPKTVSCLDFLNHKKAVEKQVAVVGGGLVGCEIALELIKEGKDVKIIEALPEILKAGAAVPLPNRTYLLDTFAKEKTEIHTGCRLEAVNDTGAVVRNASGKEEVIPADNVIIAIGFRPLPSMRKELQETGAELYEIGDGRKVGNILSAVWDAYEAARNI